MPAHMFRKIPKEYYCPATGIYHHWEPRYQKQIRYTIPDDPREFTELCWDGDVCRYCGKYKERSEIVDCE